MKRKGCAVSQASSGKLNQTGSEVELACKAQECSVTSILPGGSTSVQTLRAGDTGVVSASGSISVVVTK